MSSIILLGLSPVVLERQEDSFGEGIMSGLEASRSAVPMAPTEEESRKPGLERSIIYQRTGFTRKRVREAWRFDVQGSLRYRS